MGLIAQEWAGFEKQVLNANEVPVGEIQRRETRRAFYGGALSMFTAINRVLDPGMEPTAKDLVVMESIAEELRQYMQDLKTGRA